MDLGPPQNDKVFLFAVVLLLLHLSVFPASSMAAASSAASSSTDPPRRRRTASPTQDCLVQVPQGLLENLNALRPICMFYWNHRRNKKEKKCPRKNCHFRHSDDSTLDCRVPFITFGLEKDGTVRPSMRPPIFDCLQLFLQNHGVKDWRMKAQWLGGIQSPC